MFAVTERKQKRSGRDLKWSIVIPTSIAVLIMVCGLSCYFGLCSWLFKCIGECCDCCCSTKRFCYEEFCQPCVHCIRDKCRMLCRCRCRRRHPSNPETSTRRPAPRLGWWPIIWGVGRSTADTNSDTDGERQTPRLRHSADTARVNGITFRPMLLWCRLVTPRTIYQVIIEQSSCCHSLELVWRHPIEWRHKEHHQLE